MGTVASSMKEILRISTEHRGLILNNLRKQNKEKAELGFINLKNAGLGTANVGLKMFRDSSLEADYMNAASFKQNNLKMLSATDIRKEGNKDAAAIKIQKVYRAYRTRRNLADCAVLSDELWWHAIDSIKLEQNLFYNTAISRWSCGLKAAKVCKGLSKDENARQLAVKHWLEAIDPRHRYGRNLHMYYDEWFKVDTVQPFFHWLDIGEGKELNLQDKCPRSRLNKEHIKYLGPKEREHYEVIPENGKLIYKKSGELIDTTEGCEESGWIFVMSTSKELYVGKKLRGTFDHSSFLAGGATSAAGKLTVQDGVLKAIWPYSGHYHHTEQNFAELLNFLKESGIDTADAQMGSYSEAAHSLSVTMNASKKRKNPPETLDSNNLQEKQTNTMDIDENNFGMTNAEPERDQNQLTNTLKANILHEAHSESHTLDENKNNNIAPFHDEEQNGSEVKTGMSLLPSQLGSTEDERTKTGAGEKDQDPVHYKRSLSRELENQKLQISPTKLLERINSKKEIQSYQLGNQLSFKWSSGVGPRIGCIADYPIEIRVKAFELVNTVRGTSPF